MPPQLTFLTISSGLLLLFISYSSALFDGSFNLNS